MLKTFFVLTAIEINFGQAVMSVIFIASLPILPLEELEKDLFFGTPVPLRLKDQRFFMQ